MRVMVQNKMAHVLWPTMYSCRCVGFTARRHTKCDDIFYYGNFLFICLYLSVRLIRGPCRNSSSYRRIKSSFSFISYWNSDKYKMLHLNIYDTFTSRFMQVADPGQFFIAGT